jgi:predicted Zn-dependent protease
VPDSPALHNQLAWLYGKHEKGRAKGLALARKAHQLAPEDGAILDTLGWLYSLNGQHARAVEHLQRASAKLPHDPDVWSHLARAQEAAGKPEAAARSRAMEKLLRN